MKRRVKCSKCEHIGPEDEFPKGHDFFQHKYIAECPKCDNRQSPGDASMRMFGGERPFVFVDRCAELEVRGDRLADAVPAVVHRSKEAS